VKLKEVDDSNKGLTDEVNPGSLNEEVKIAGIEATTPPSACFLFVDAHLRHISNLLLPFAKHSAQ